jgi:hypothetical protein
MLPPDQYVASLLAGFAFAARDEVAVALGDELLSLLGDDGHGQPR